MLVIIKNNLFKKLVPTLSYLQMDSSVDSSEHHETAQKSNTDPSIDVLLLSTHIGGLGLNLIGHIRGTGLEPYEILQAMDRVHRIGQKSVVNVYRLITRSTLERPLKIQIKHSQLCRQSAKLWFTDTQQILVLFNLIK
ncbi:unnamed protein product [Mucor hiemalis]